MWETADCTIAEIIANPDTTAVASMILEDREGSPSALAATFLTELSGINVAEREVQDHRKFRCDCFESEDE